MPMARIDALEIQHFRGVTGLLTLEFGPEPLTVIYGENGTGKTSIVDAIDLVGNQHVGSIREKSSTTIAKHAPALGHRPADIAVTARWNERRWTARIGASKVVVEPLPLLPVRVLRQSNIQRFIDAAPSARYQEIRHLLDVDQVERAEKALNDAAGAAATFADRHARDRAAATAMLHDLWQGAGAPGDDAEAWARGWAAGAGDVRVAREADSRLLRDALERLLRARDEFLQGEDRVAAAEARLAESERGIAAGGMLNATQAIDLARVLESVQRVLGGPGAGETCPACEQPVDTERLRETVQARLETLDNWRRLDATRTERLAQMQVEGQQQERLAAGLVEAATAVVRLVGEDDHGTGALAGIERYRVADPDDALAVAGRIAHLPEQLDRERQAAAERRGQLAAVRSALETIDAAAEGQNEAAVMAGRLRAALGIVREERHRFTQDILDEIADDANRLYQRLHPGEGLAMSRLMLDPKQRASLNQFAAFGDATDVPPQAYFSEAHLDTLGFCAWLADVRRQSAREPLIVVIDDVFSAADGHHLRRLARLLVEEAPSFGQVIVTTHSPGFRDLLAEAGAPVLTLDNRWSLERGVRVTVE
jgi:ABC-type transport system involved in cytochrome c biogenesis ATPase subunit